jgi:hypothetical protein
MSMRKLMLAVPGAALVVTPVLGQVAFAPVAAPLNGDESEAGGGTGIALGLVAAAAIVGGVLLASGNDDAYLSVSG